MSERINESIIHRETHSSRAISAVVMAVLLLAISLYALVGALLELVGHPLWFMSVSTLVKTLSMPSGSAGFPVAVALGGVGVVLALLGLVFIVKALLPGTLARTGQNRGRTAVVYDDQALASAVAAAARRITGLPPGHVLASVAGHNVTVRVKPIVGLIIDEQLLASTLTENVRELFAGTDRAGRRTPRVRVLLSQSAAAGARI